MSKTLPPLPEREAFEAWMQGDATISLEKDGHGYVDMTAELMWHAWKSRAAIEAQGVPDGWREFVHRVAGQKPEKPDYWSACGQCERNTSDAEDLISSAPQALHVFDAHQEPVGWCAPRPDVVDWRSEEPEVGTPLYTSPAPQVKPQPLSDEQRRAIVAKWKGGNWSAGDIIDAVEAEHGIKGE